MKFYKGWQVKKLASSQSSSSELVNKKIKLKEAEFFMVSYPLQFLSTEGRFFYYPQLTKENKEDLALESSFPKWTKTDTNSYLLTALKFNKIMSASPLKELEEVIKDNDDNYYRLEDLQKIS